MKDRKTLQEYINNFRRHMVPHLRPSVGVSCVAFPVEGPGAILEFTIGPDITNEDRFRDPMPSVNAALAHISQRAFGGTLAGFRFKGTNIVGEENRVIILKGEDAATEWIDAAAFADVSQIVQQQIRAGKNVGAGAGAGV